MYSASIRGIYSLVFTHDPIFSHASSLALRINGHHGYVHGQRRLYLLTADGIPVGLYGPSGRAKLFARWILGFEVGGTLDVFFSTTA